MELDLQSLFVLHVYTADVHIGWDPPPLPPHLGSYTRALVVSQDRRHLLVTPCAAKALYSCPAIISQRLESRIISKEPQENTEEESKII